METDDISDLEINDELRGLISGNFEDVVERQENIEIEENRKTGKHQTW